MRMDMNKLFKENQELIDMYLYSLKSNVGSYYNEIKRYIDRLEQNPPVYNINNFSSFVNNFNSLIRDYTKIATLMDINQKIKDDKNKDYEKISIFISRILRHTPEEIGAKLDDFGYMSTDVLIAGLKSKGFDIDLDTLIDIVTIDPKGRYELTKDNKFIKARYGHSIRIKHTNCVCPPNFLYHGSATKYSDSITKNGIINKSRTHVHLTSILEDAIEVGARHGNPVVYTVNAGAMYEDGYDFYKIGEIYLVDEVPFKYITEVARVNTLEDK